MKAALFHEPHQPLTIEEVDIARPMAHEILVRTAASGVCHSDLHHIEGLYPLAAPCILGHEAAGVVEEVGEQVTYLQPGDHIIACLSAFCGTCEKCTTGHPNLCTTRRAAGEHNLPLGRTPSDPPKLRLSGSGAAVHQYLNVSSFAEKMLLHENAVVKIDDDMPLDRAALIGCGVMTGTGAVLNTARIEPGSTVAVFGAGGVGLAAIQGARIAGARQIIAVDVVELKLAHSMEMGATHVVDASSRDPVQAIRELTGGGCGLLFRGHRPQRGGRGGVPLSGSGRHRDHHRHDPGGSEDRDRGEFIHVGEEDPG